MKYHKVSTAWDPKIIGVNNGVYQGELIPKKFQKQEDYNALADFFDYSSYWTRDDHRPTKAFNFEYVKLLKKARLTDIISFSPNLIGIDFLISSKASRLLDGLNLPNSYFFDASIYTFDNASIEGKYFALYTTYLGFHCIDFSRTTFCSGNEILGKTYHHFKNYQDWKDYWDRPKHELIQAEKIGLKSEFANADFIKTRLGGPFVSERLLDMRVNNDITGFIERSEPVIELI